MTSPLIRRFVALSLGAGLALSSFGAFAAPPASDKSKSKFYDFSDQLIDGEVKKPSALYTEARSRAEFGRLLKLKKSFRSAMVETSKERVLK